MESLFLQPEQLVAYKDAFNIYRTILVDYVYAERLSIRKRWLANLVKRIEDPITSIDIALDNLDDPYSQITQTMMNRAMQFIKNEAQLVLDNFQIFALYTIPGYDNRFPV